MEPTSDLEPLGYYQPGFLHLRVNIDSRIDDLNDLIKRDPRSFSTFLHEYIHFIQNITTTSGLWESIFYVDFIKDVNWRIRHDGKPEFDVPVALTSENNIKPNLDLMKIYRGTADGPEYAIYKGYSTEDVIIVEKNGHSIIAKKYIVHYLDGKTAKTGNLHFGASCLKEYVAHVVQKTYMPAVEHSDIPYVIAEQIVKKECPTFGDNPLFVATLCDACLMCFHPAQIFFATIERMKQKNFAPKDTASVVNFVFDGVTFEGQGQVESVESLFINTVDLVDKQFQDALQSPPFLPNYEWLHYIISKGRWLRLNYPTFITELVQSGGNLSPTFFDVARQLGTPFFTNRANQGSFIPPEKLQALNVQPYQLLVFKEIIGVFMGSRKCSLTSFCKTRPDKDITNNKCHSAPWERATEDELCPFGQLWRTWGLVGEVPQFKGTAI